MELHTLACDSKAFQRPRTVGTDIYALYSTRSHTSGTSRSSCIIISREPKIYHSMLESHDWATCKHHTAVIQAKKFPRSHSGFFLTALKHHCIRICRPRDGRNALSVTFATFMFESIDLPKYEEVLTWHDQWLKHYKPSWTADNGACDGSSLS